MNQSLKDSYLRYIAFQQFIQQRNPPDSQEWKQASAQINHIAGLIVKGGK